MTGQPAAIVEMVRAGEIVLTFDLSAQAASALALLKKYADRRHGSGGRLHRPHERARA